MKEEFKKWLCEKAKEEYKTIIDRHYYTGKPIYRINKITLETLIKAMWAINREGEWNIKLDSHCIVFHSRKDYCDDMYDFTEYSEQKALKKALEYIYEQELNK